jgi:phage tail sheath protein FI
MIENFLATQWRQGALMGSKQSDAFKVSVGLGTTMTGLDVLEGRMIVVVALCPVRPAEFIILRFVQTMPAS